MLLPLFIACSATPVVGDAPAAEDTDIDTAGDTGSNLDDTDTGDTDDTGNSIEDNTDWSAYTGERNFFVSVWGYECDDDTEDEGVELTEGSDYDALVALCPLCSHFYENTPSVDSVCDGYLGLGTTYRALLVTEAGIAAYFYSEGDSGPTESASDASVAFDGELAEFDYELEVYSVPIAVTGSMTFESVW